MVSPACQAKNDEWMQESSWTAHAPGDAGNGRILFEQRKTRKDLGWTGVHNLSFRTQTEHGRDTDGTRTGHGRDTDGTRTGHGRPVKG